MTQKVQWARNLFCLALLIGCRDRAAESSTDGEPIWTLNNHPEVDIGVAEGDEHYELAGASSSIRLTDGRVVIANSGTSELRVFDSTGRFVTSIGRKGEGPGEFAGSLQMAAISPTEFAVFDQSAQRLSAFDTSGSLIRESRVMADGTDGGFPLWVWLHRDAWISGPVDTVRRGDIARALDMVPERVAGSYLYVMVATDGRIWLQLRTPTQGSHPWAVLDSRGALLGLIHLPDSTEVHQIGPDYVLLRHWGANDVEHIQLYRFEEHRVANMASSVPPAIDSTVDNSSLRRSMAGMLRNLVMAQEMYYADHAGYARDADSLSWEHPPEVKLYLIAADKRGWVGVLVHQRGLLLCGMAVGGSTPPGWMEGSPTCSR